MASPSSDHGTYVSQNFPELIEFLLPGIRPLSMEPLRFFTKCWHHARPRCCEVTAPPAAAGRESTFDHQFWFSEWLFLMKHVPLPGLDLLD